MVDFLMGPTNRKVCSPNAQCGKGKLNYIECKPVLFLTSSVTSRWNCCPLCLDVTEITREYTMDFSKISAKYLLSLARQQSCSRNLYLLLTNSEVGRHIIRRHRAEGSPPSISMTEGKSMLDNRGWYGYRYGSSF